MLRLCFPLLYKGKYIPVGRRVFRETLIKGRKQKSPLILLPPYISVHELRLMLNINYDVCFKAANVYKCGNKYTWKDPENRVFQTVNKRNVIIPYSTAAYVSKLFHFKPKLIEVELRCPETQQSENLELSEIYKKVYMYEDEFYKKGKINFEQVERKKEFAVVSVIGHINHGKTTLLDKITNNNLALEEAGCITQNIKTIHFEEDWESEWNPGKVKNTDDYTKRYSNEKQPNERKKIQKSSERFQFTFVDTPGHEVFQIFRGRAAFISDILIILVSLEVGAEIQTEEAIKYADKFNLPVIFALNKFDLYYENECVVKAELKNQCRKMFDTGDLKRDYSKEIDNSICISSLNGYNLNKLINRLFFFSKIINFPYHSINTFYSSKIFKKDLFSDANQEKQNFTKAYENSTVENIKDEETKWKENSTMLQKYIRKSDCLLALDCQPIGTGIVIDISKDSSRGTLLNVVIRNGFFMEGNYFICGSAYGKIQKMYKHNTNFKENCTYATVGMAIQISGIKKYGNPATDDLIFTLPQNNAFRLCQYRLMVEKLCSLQISGAEIQVSWENDMKKNEFQAEDIYKNRMQMTQKRKAIEEFGGTYSNSNDTLFQPVSLEDFYKSNTQLRKENNLVEIDLEEERETEIEIQRKLQKRENIQKIISADNTEESILVPEDEHREFISVDNFAKERILSKGCIYGENKEKDIGPLNSMQRSEEKLAISNIEPVGIHRINKKNDFMSNTDDSREKKETIDMVRQTKVELNGDVNMPHIDSTTNESIRKSRFFEKETNKSENVAAEELIIPVRGRKNKTYNNFNVGKKWIKEEIDQTTEKDNKTLQEPWYYEGNEKQWTENVLKRNEKLTEKWRSKTRQRELEQERQKLYEKKMILQNEITKRRLLGEEELTEEEIHKYIHEDIPEDNASETSLGEQFQIPQKNCPVIPIIIRTNYVGVFDIFLDEFEKLQKQYNVKIAVVHGGVGPITPNDVVHAEVESEFGYCCIYAFQVKILPDSVKQAVLSKIVIKQFDVFTDLLDDVVNRIKNIKRLVKHNMYVRSLKTENL